MSVPTIAEQIESWKSAIREREREVERGRQQLARAELDLAFCRRRLAETEAQLAAQE